MGFLSDSKFVFDVTGETRDIAYAMALSNLYDDAVISSEFISEVKSVFKKHQCNINTSELCINSKQIDVIRLSLSGK